MNELKQVMNDHIFKQIRRMSKETFICREFYKGEWVTTRFDNMRQAKTLMMKILKKGGVAIALRETV